MSVKAANSSTQKVGKFVEVTIPEYERVLVRMTWKKANAPKGRRVLVLVPDPSSEPSEYKWPPRSDGTPPFFIKGRFRIAQKINHPAKAAAAWKKEQPA